MFKIEGFIHFQKADLKRSLFRSRMRPLDPTLKHLVKFREKKGKYLLFSLTSFSKDPTFLFTLFFSDGLSLRLGPGSVRSRHLEGLLELRICRLDPSIGMSQASGTGSASGLSSEFGGLTHH